MKLLRWGPKGAEKPGLLDEDGAIRDLSGAAADLSGEAVSLRALDALRRLDPARLPVVEGTPRIGACLADAPNVFCVGLNYARHAAETGAKLPAEPILFNKATSALAGPADPVTIPPGSEATDWEIELGVVIGRPVERVSQAEALGCVAGYMTLNDLSERHWQKDRGGQWVKGKSAPGFCPIGPWLVTADEVPEPQALPLWLDLNGETMQLSSTADMIFGVAEIIAYMSRFMVLRPGDVIATGTPEGVGLGMKPPRFLRPGDAMTCAVEGLGTQRLPVVAHPDA
jgi:2-keto-4-pentenoate hydratase/2-oxohepta-3-ene-1,7-dioic acid hydratase in catechol pathway